MENNKMKSDVAYIKADDNKIINETAIKWVKKMDECLYICTKSTGCTQEQTHTLCKINNMESYSKLNTLFER
jgi:hypothetical protein